MSDLFANILYVQNGFILEHTLSFTSGRRMQTIKHFCLLNNQWNQIRVAGNASGSEIMVAKLSRWEAIADSLQNLRLRPFGMVLNWFPKSICVSEASPTACDFHSRPTGFPKRSFQKPVPNRMHSLPGWSSMLASTLFRRTRRTPKL